MTSTGHLLPFSIDTEGLVNAESYMKIVPCTRSDQQHPTLPTLETHVRGRRLVGLDVKLRPPVQGKQPHPFVPNSTFRKDDQEEIHWKKLPTPTIGNIILWKKDYAPSDMDARLRTIEDWFDIANAVNVFFFSTCHIQTHFRLTLHIDP
ncbi:hypothetical protein BX666DRAFT_1868101 [Dichotomocladium elegans]|nr:hypothetical protein BX666DRAFT_1868101 [Dichotomocladium elegans]